jgi:hypothetical protein
MVGNSDESLEEGQNGIRSPGGQKGADHTGHHHRHSLLGRVAVTPFAGPPNRLLVVVEILLLHFLEIGRYPLLVLLLRRLL